MLMNKTYSRLLAFGVSASVLGVSLQASSANIPAIAGLMTGPAIRSGAGYLNNSSLSTASVEIPIPVTSNKTWALSARVHGNGASSTSCHGVRYDSQNNALSGGTGSTSATTFQGITLGSVNLPAGSGSSLTVVCDLVTIRNGVGGAVESVDFN